MIYADNWVKIKQILRSSVLKLKDPLRKTCSGQKNVCYLTPIVWNSLPMELKLLNSLNNFKHKLKEHFFKKFSNMLMIYLLVDAVLRASNSEFPINWHCSTNYNVIVFYGNIFKKPQYRLVFIFSRLLILVLILIVLGSCFFKGLQWK